MNQLLRPKNFQSEVSFPDITRVNSAGKKIEYNWWSLVYHPNKRVAVLLGVWATYRESMDMDISAIKIDGAISNSHGFVRAYIVWKVLWEMNVDPKRRAWILKYELQIAYTESLKEWAQAQIVFLSYLKWRKWKFQQQWNAEEEISLIENIKKELIPISPENTHPDNSSDTR